MIQLFRVYIPVSVLGLVLSEFLVLFLCYASASFLLFGFINSDFSPIIFFQTDSGILRIAIVVISIGASLYFQNLYSSFRVTSLTLLMQQLCMALGIGFLIQASFTYMKRPEWGVPKWIMIFGSALTLILLPVWRLFYGTYVLKAMGTRRVLFLGTTPVIQEIAQKIADHAEVGMKNLGYIDDCSDTPALPGGAILGGTDDLTQIANRLKPDLVVVGTLERRAALPIPEMLQLRFSGIRFEEETDTFESTFGRVLTRQFRPSRLIYSTELGPGRRSLLWHSLYSTVVAVLVTPIFLPVIAIVAVLVKLTSPGPIFHRQVRVGLNGAPFTVYKFRSMHANAEAQTGAVWAKKDDPRVTKVGKWLRRLRLDEMPQLLNVLRGEMSLVGPRPERPEFVESLTKEIPYYTYRHCVKPGITGWAQINYKYGDTLEDTIIKLEYDLYYIKNLALWLDTFIIFHTLKVMLFSETAQ